MNAFQVWWKRQGLRLRLQLLIQGFLVVVLGAVQVWGMARFEEQVLSGAEARAREVADGIVNGLNTLMVTRIGGTDVISDKKARITFIHKMGDGDRIKEVRVARAKSMDEEFPEPLPEEKPVDAVDQRVLENGKSEYHLQQDADGKSSLRVVVPFLNVKDFRGTNCLDCHGEAEGATLGIASVVVDVQEEMHTIAQAKSAFWIVQILLQVSCAVMLYFVARRIVRQLGGEPEVAANLAQQVAQGDLTVKLQVDPRDTTSMMARLKDMQAGLVRVVSDVRRSAEGLAAASTQIAHGNQDLSTRTEEQASALDVTASSMEQLGVTVARNADHARQANELALSASTVAVKGGQVVGQVVDTMRDINTSSKKIADIISVIDSIAFQTNILALNAAVEAARAGEQGRGFAVVASEVRMLAQRSADASKEIKNLISGSVDRVEQGTALVDQAGATMQEIVTSIKRVTDIMGEISTASAEQSAGVAQIGQAITKMDRHTQQNAALVEQSAAAAQSLNDQAQQLLQAVAVFKMERADTEQV